MSLRPVVASVEQLMSFYSCLFEKCATSKWTHCLVEGMIMDSQHFADRFLVWSRYKELSLV